MEYSAHASVDAAAALERKDGTGWRAGGRMDPQMLREREKETTPRPISPLGPKGGKALGLISRSFYDRFSSSYYDNLVVPAMSILISCDTVENKVGALERRL